MRLCHVVKFLPLPFFLDTSVMRRLARSLNFHLKTWNTNSNSSCQVKLRHVGNKHDQHDVALHAFDLEWRTVNDQFTKLPTTRRSCVRIPQASPSVYDTLCFSWASRLSFFVPATKQVWELARKKDRRNTLGNQRKHRVIKNKGD